LPLLSTLVTPEPYHILSFGLLFGTQIWQSFISGTSTSPASSYFIILLQRVMVITVNSLLQNPPPRPIRTAPKSSLPSLLLPADRPLRHYSAHLTHFHDQN